MCELGKCVLEIIPNADAKCVCNGKCYFNDKDLDQMIDELETVELKTEGPMFDGILNKRKQ